MYRPSQSGGEGIMQIVRKPAKPRVQLILHLRYPSGLLSERVMILPAVRTARESVKYLHGS